MYLWGIQRHEHIYSCEIINSEIEKVALKKIFGNNLREMKKISERFRKIFEDEEQEKTNIQPRILKVDPLYSNYTVMEFK